MKGWFREPYRHYLASQGISTKRYKAAQFPALQMNPPEHVPAKGEKIEFVELKKRRGDEFELAPSSDPREQKSPDPELELESEPDTEPKSQELPELELDGQKPDGDEKFETVSDVVDGVLTYHERQRRDENARRRLALRGQRLYARKQDVPIEANPLKPGYVYPISPQEVDRRLKQMPEKDLRGFKGVEFTMPRDKDQQGAWAQYLRGKRKLLLFAQKQNNGKIDNQPVAKVNNHIKEYVLPHEIGHHKALYQARITDKSLPLAEARADANVLGLDPADKEVALLARNA